MILLKIFNRGAYLGLSPPHGQYIQSKVFLQERSRGNFEMTHKEDREEEEAMGWANVATSQRVPAAFRAGGE